MSVDWIRGISLLRRACKKLGLPQFWHKNSPHTYEVWQHVVMLVFCRHYCSSYADFVEWLPHSRLPEYVHLKCVPDEGTLCKEEQRLRPYLYAVSVLLIAPLLPQRYVAAADMTGLQMRRASSYYIRRILGTEHRRGYARLELVVWKRFILGWELRLLHKDELAMLKSLWKNLTKPPSTLVYDKKGDAEPHHQWLEAQNIHSIAPVRKRGHKGFYRRKLLKHFPQKTYNKRNRVENVNFLFKHRFGDALQAYTLKGRRAEIATKVAAHNLFARLKTVLNELFNAAQEPKRL